MLLRKLICCSYLSLKLYRVYECRFRPTIPVTLNGGMRMPSWFDLKSLDPNGPEDENGIKTAADKVRKMIQNEVSCAC